MYTSHLLHHTLNIPHQYTSSMYLINLASLMTSHAVSVTLLMKIPTGWGISLRCEANMRHHRGGTSIKHVATGLLVLITTAAFIYSGSSSRTLRPGPKNRMLIATPLATAVALAANSDLAVAIIPQATITQVKDMKQARVFAPHDNNRSSFDINEGAV